MANKLVLKTESVRILASGDLTQVIGGQLLPTARSPKGEGQPVIRWLGLAREPRN